MREREREESFPSVTRRERESQRVTAMQLYFSYMYSCTVPQPKVLLYSGCMCVFMLEWW